MTAATLSDLTASATGPTSMYADQDTPEGYFQVTTCVLGIVSTYLLKGELESADAEIVGRVELPKLKDIGKARPNGYKGDSLKGGQLFLFESYKEAFARMV